MSKIRVGVFGGGRGADLARNFLRLGCEVVALCDFNESRLAWGKETLGIEVATYTNFDEFLNHEMDAVLIANYFNEHAPYTIKCFKKNLHVLCECISNGTMAEGIELLDAFKNSKSIYMLAENYPFMIFNREITRICEGGTLGKIMYAEGEYNHPTAKDDIGFLKDYNYYAKHWRNYLPATYYITHSIGPIMHATKAKPIRVTALPVFLPFDDETITAKQTADRSAIITTLNHDGSVFKVTGCANFGAHHNSYRVCGEFGSIENLRGMNDQVMLRYNDWNKPEGYNENNLYKPGWNHEDEAEIIASGHGGADYLTVRTFVECIKQNKQPEYPFDLRSAILMSSVAILAHKSILNGGQPYDIPDFENETDREKYKDDYSSPFVGTKGENPTISCCSNENYRATDKQLDSYNEALEKVLK